MAKEVYRIEIPIETTDKYSKGLENAKKDIDGFEKSVDKAEKEMQGFEKTVKKTDKEVSGFEKTVQKTDKGVTKFEKSSQGASKGVEKVGGSAKKSEGEVTKFQGALQKTRTRLREISARKWEMTIRAVDRASRVISTVNSFVHRVANRSYRFTIRAVDMASRVIGTVRRGLLSIPSMITVGLAVIGVNQLSKSTVGAAMDFEQYGVSMEHWLKGNTKQAQELVQWMGQFADKTPFSSPDLFPALTRAIGISRGDISQSKELLKLASDMAALTPGSSVSDAMEALADAQMGEFERLKAFNQKITQEEFKKIGYSGVIERLSKDFSGGAEKLSKTSAGIIATLKGYRSSLLRTMGEGFLEPMKPRLDAINKWLENNQETWGRWKDTVRVAGDQASEWLFSRLETGFNYIRTRYLENEEFKKLDFEGKVNFVLGDIKKWWAEKGKPAMQEWWDSTGQPWAEDIGLLMGEAIFNGIIAGAKNGLKAIGGMWKDFGKDPSVGSFGGALTSTLLAGAIGSMLLSPLLKTAGGVLKGGRKVVGGGKWVWDKTIGKRAPKPSEPKPKQGTKTYSEIMKERVGSNTTQKNTTTSSKKLPKMPKVPSALKRVPYIGPMLGILGLAGLAEGEIPGAIGSIGGGAAGAAGGAALGSLLFPGVGTAVGGVAGGILGSIGGEKLLSKIFAPKKASATSANEGNISVGGQSIQPYIQENIYKPINQAVANASKFGMAFGNNFVIGLNQSSSTPFTWISEKINQPIIQAIGNATAFGQGFSANFIIGLNKASDTPFTWIQQKIYQPLLQAIGNAIPFGQGLANNFAIGIGQGQVNIHPWISSNLYQPILQAISNARSFGQGYASNMQVGINSTQISIHPWIQTYLYQPVLQAIRNAQPFGSAYASNIGLGVNNTPINIHPWISTNLYQPILQAVGNATSFGSGFAGNFITGMRSRKEDVSAEARALAKAVESAFRSELGIASPSKVMRDLGFWSAMGVVKGFSSVDIGKIAKKQADALASSFSGGAAPGSVRQWIMAAMMATGTPMSWLGPLSTIAMKESGGNPRAINLWDINAKRGIPSKGLMQTIGPTFNSYKGKGMNDIYNPIHNAVAAIRYIKSRYGNVFNVPGIKSMARGGAYRGYEHGGVINREHIAKVGERNKREVIIPLEQHRSRALGLLGYAQRALGVEPIVPVTPVSSPSGNTAALNGGGKGATVIVEGGVNPTVIVQGADVDDPDALAAKIADKVAGIVADKVERVALNMPAV